LKTTLQGGILMRMSSGTIIILVLVVLVIVTALAFTYGFRMGLRAERSNWDLRYMVKSVPKVLREESISELEVALNEQLGFWTGEPDDVDSQFCENFFKTIELLRPHMEALEKESGSLWKTVSPIWDQLNFKKVSMATCLEYALCRSKVLDILKNLLTAVGRKPSRKLAL